MTNRERAALRKETRTYEEILQAQLVLKRRLPNCMFDPVVERTCTEMMDDDFHYQPHLPGSGPLGYVYLPNIERGDFSQYLLITERTTYD